MDSNTEINLKQFHWDADDTDKDANFKNAVALYTMSDPMPAIDRISRNLSIPVGSIVKYVLCKWTMSGSDALLEVGPDMVNKMTQIFEEAEFQGTAEARLEAYASVKSIVSWLRVPLDDADYRNVQ
tara:strand:+ start:2471 stop:2848 length:378 start_codon:yes stop_codon:yes gene_type:complete